MLIWLLGSALGVLHCDGATTFESVSAVFVGFSFVGIGTVWRTKDPLITQTRAIVGSIFAPSHLFVAPIGFGAGS